MSPNSSRHGKEDTEARLAPGDEWLGETLGYGGG